MEALFTENRDGANQRKMKIGILTQPFNTNYGGLLQAYALQTVLRRMGHQTLFLTRESKYLHIRSIVQRIAFRLYILVREIMMGANAYFPNKRERNTIRKNTDVFVEKYLNHSPYLRNTSELRKYTLKKQFDAYIVGSDQVWRPDYSPYIPNYFLDFAVGQNAIKLAYAASFGVSDWCFTDSQTRECSELIKQFKAVSVRENTAILLCKEFLGISAQLVLDPTLLLDKDDYIQLVNEAEEEHKNGNLFCYVLDESLKISTVVSHIAEQTGLIPFTTMPKRGISNRINAKFHLNDCVFPRVTEWIRSFMDAEMVVTDSFHGCIFSILFNKPFWVVGNKDRGLARFESLLALYKLESRYISEDTMKIPNINETIDWEYVNRRTRELRIESLGFLKKYLSPEI